MEMQEFTMDPGHCFQLLCCNTYVGDYDVSTLKSNTACIVYTQYQSHSKTEIDPVSVRICIINTYTIHYAYKTEMYYSQVFVI